MTKLYCHKLGKLRCFLGIRGDSREEIEQQFWSFSNRKAAESELEWMTDDFACFSTRPDKILKALKSAELAKIVNEINEKENRYNDPSKELAEEDDYRQEADKRGRERFDAIISEPFYQIRGNNIKEYSAQKDYEKY